MTAKTDTNECGGFVTETLSILYTALARAGTPIPQELRDRYAAAFKQARKLENV